MTESTPIRVLHVDDSPEFGELVKLYLEREHDALDVTVAECGRTALTHLSDADFDCIVSDYNMAELDGLELLDRVRETHPDLPFILFTGRGSEEIASEAISAGITDYLQKETGTEQYTVLANRVVNAVESTRSQKALEESTQRSQTLIEKSSEAIFIIQGGTFAFVNDRATELTGYDRSELNRLDFFTLVHPADRDRVREIAASQRDGDGAQETYAVALQTKSGAVRDCELRVQAITHNGDYAVLGFARDISAQKEYEETLETLHDATRELMRAETKRDVCEITVDTARSELGFSMTGTWLYDEWTDTLTPVANTAEREAIVGPLPSFAPGDNLAWTVYEEGERAIFDDVRDADPIHNPNTEIWSEAALPLGEYGVVISSSTTANAFSELDIEFLELLATNTEAALARAEREAEHRQLAQQLRATNRKIEALHGIATEMESCTSEAEICSLTVDAAERILAFDICVVDIEAEGMLETRSLSSEIRPEETPTMAVTEGIAGKTYRTGETYLYDDIRTVPAAKPPADYRSLISVPIGNHGVFQAGADEVGFFDDQDVELAELLLSHTAEALTRVEREQQLRERQTRLRQQNDQLEAFASIVSHDLRNPLNVAQGNLEFLSADGSTHATGHGQASPADRLERALAALDRMEGIIHDVLTLARQGQVVDDFETVRIDTIARRAWATVETPDATLTLDCESNFDADPGRLQQLLENLFRNAVDHARPDVAVTVTAIEGGFAVEDDGPGIPAHARKSVRSAEYTTAGAGTGLGLAIVDRIVDAHGWTLTITDSQAGGARFEIRTGS